MGGDMKLQKDTIWIYRGAYTSDTYLLKVLDNGNCEVLEVLREHSLYSVGYVGYFAYNQNMDKIIKGGQSEETV